MGIYLRESIRVGPMRFNLSKGGVGVSVGVKGFRVGSGPRGNYVHMGAHGIYYRTTIPSLRQATASARTPSGPPPLPLNTDPVIPDGTVGPMVDIDSAPATQIVDSSSQALLDELNMKQRRSRLWPWALAASVVLFFVLIGNGLPPWTILSFMALATLGVAWIAFNDVLRKTVVLMYELEPSLEVALEGLHEAAQQLTSAAGVWHVASRASVHDSKYHAGASSLISRKATRFDRAAPPFVKTNIQTVAVVVGEQTLHFFPDRVLIYDSKGVGAVSFSELRAHAGETSFIEDGAVPRDATVIGHTWRYVNKKGGPDKRFKDNRQLSICRYDELSFQSNTGLNELLHVSRAGSVSAFVNALKRLTRALPQKM